MKLFYMQKDSGRAGSENKFEFPPPVDNELYFGNCILLNLKGNIKKKLNGKIYIIIYMEDLKIYQMTMKMKKKKPIYQ